MANAVNCASAIAKGRKTNSESAGLVVNMIVLWNTIYIEAALDQLRKEGFEVRNEDLDRLSPLIHDHINMLGRYSFACRTSLQEEGSEQYGIPQTENA